MTLINRLVELLKPFRDLVVIVVALLSAGYAALTYFATADQLEKARAELEELQDMQHSAALSALQELRCFNQLNRSLLRAELEDFRLTTLLQKNISDSEKLRNDDSEFARVTRETLSASRQTLSNQLREADIRKREAIMALGEDRCGEGS